MPMEFITSTVLSILVQLHKLTGNLGLSILLFTFILRSLLVPLSLPSIKSQKKIQALKPELDKLKQKHKGDNKAMQLAQMELYKKYNVNPLSGCIPQIVQLVIVIVLYQVLINFLSQTEVNGVMLNPQFLWLDLSKPDSRYIIPVLAGVTQFILSMMIIPGGETADVIPNDSKKKEIQLENKKEENTAEMASMMQKQMLFVMPIMTGVIAINFPSGLGLYWVATTVFSIVQQLIFSGPGGLTLYARRAYNFVISKVSPKEGI